MRYRNLTLVAVLTVATFLMFVLQAEGQGSPTPAASPASASPAASPGASPVAGAVDVEAAERGRVAAAICLACHSVDGSVMVGPTWQGLWGSELEYEDGSTAIVDEALIVDSINDPMAHIVKGYPPSMPPLGATLTEQQINDIIEYIKSLQ